MFQKQSHYAKSIQILSFFLVRSFSYLNCYGVLLQCKYGKIWTRKNSVFGQWNIKTQRNFFQFFKVNTFKKYFHDLATKRIGCDSSLCWKSCVSAGASWSRVKRPRDCVYANQRSYHESEPMSKIWGKCTCSGSWHHGGARYFSLIALYWKNMPKHRPKLRK